MRPRAPRFFGKRLTSFDQERQKTTLLSLQVVTYATHTALTSIKIETRDASKRLVHRRYWLSHSVARLFLTISWSSPCIGRYQLVARRATGSERASARGQLAGRCPSPNSGDRWPRGGGTHGQAPPRRCRRPGWGKTSPLDPPDSRSHWLRLPSWTGPAHLGSNLRRRRRPWISPALAREDLRTAP